MMTQDMAYINKAHGLIEGIPYLKSEILKLQERMSVHASKEEAKRIRYLAGILKFLVDALKLIGPIGGILTDLYFYGLTKKEISCKYGYSLRSISRILRADTEESLEAWVKLSVYFYGIDAVRLKKGDNALE